MGLLSTHRKAAKDHQHFHSVQSCSTSSKGVGNPAILLLILTLLIRHIRHYHQDQQHHMYQPPSQSPQHGCHLAIPYSNLLIVAIQEMKLSAMTGCKRLTTGATESKSQIMEYGHQVD